MSDSRHHPIILCIDHHYKAHNGVPMPNVGHVAKRLAQFLKANPGWTVEIITRCIENRFASEGVNVSDPPALWINILPRYLKGPLDRFGKIKKQTTEDSVTAYWAWRSKQENPPENSVVN